MESLHSLSQAKGDLSVRTSVAGAFCEVRWESGAVK